MALKCGIVGLPNVGKSTLFNALTSAKALAANYPFATKDPNVGMITVPDERLDKLSDLVNPQKVQPTTIEILDIAGLIKGASQGKGLAINFLQIFVRWMRSFMWFGVLKMTMSSMLTEAWTLYGIKKLSIRNCC